MNFIELIESNGKVILVNADLILYVRRNGEGSKLYMTDSNHLEVIDSVSAIRIMLEGGNVNYHI
jgi:hypothetical protein